MIKNKDIIIVSIQPWDIKIGSNCKNIAEVLANNNRVLYVNVPLDRKTKATKKDQPEIRKRINIVKGKAKALYQINNNLWNLYPRFMAESINWIKFKSLYNFFNKRNNRFFADEIKQAAKDLGFKNFILFNDSLMFTGFYLKELLQPGVFIYYIRDNLITQPYFRKHGKEMEPQLIKKADAVVSNSIYLANYAKKYNNDSFMVGQGCDVSLFNDDQGKMELPEDMKNIPSPVIGYVGALTSKRLDIDVILHIAKSRKDWNIVLVGPEDEHFKASELHHLSNVHLLGSRPGEDLPKYIKGFDVCINPQRVNDLTIGNYPRKIDEYLSMGKPVLATPTEAMEYFEEYTYLAPNKNAYVEMAEQAIKEDNKEKQDARKVFAKSHTWENNVENISAIIENYL
ncbi:MAG: glycosyltransferase [Bacteroidales bacterium]|nr:glycosyltransferase [Bacteroidales bacterium]